jgi:hypothetical protein
MYAILIGFLDQRIALEPSAAAAQYIRMGNNGPPEGGTQDRLFAFPAAHLLRLRNGLFAFLVAHLLRLSNGLFGFPALAAPSPSG